MYVCEGVYIVWYFYVLVQLNITHFKSTDCQNNNITMRKTINLETPVFIHGGYFSFSMLISLQRFSLNLMTNKST
jgi:hypothetical protein